jgi:hypothetical protein
VTGFQIHAAASYVGERFLNKRNSAPADPFTTWSAGLGWKGESWDFRIDGFNLSDRRDPVAESEMGDAQYHRLPARSWIASLGLRFWLSARPPLRPFPSVSDEGAGRHPPVRMLLGRGPSELRSAPRSSAGEPSRPSREGAPRADLSTEISRGKREAGEHASSERVRNRRCVCANSRK